MSTVGSRIRREREKMKISQIDLSKKIGINNSVLSRIEANKRPVESELLDKFAEVFGVSTDYLLGKTENPTPYILMFDNLEDYLNPEGIKSLHKLAENIEGLAFLSGGDTLTEDEIEHLKKSLADYRELKAKFIGNKKNDK